MKVNVTFPLESATAAATSNKNIVTIVTPGNTLTLLVILYLTQLIYRCFLHPLHGVPGPRLASFSRTWKIIRGFRGTWLEDIVEVHQRYGPVVRIAPNEVSFVDAGALKELYGHGKPNQKTAWYHTMVPKDVLPSMFSTTDAKLHKTLRSRVTSAYSMSSTLAAEPLIQEVLDTNKMKLKELCERGRPVNLSDWTSFFVFDNVGQLSLGGMLGCLETEGDVKGLIKSIHNIFPLLSNMGDVPGRMWWFDNAMSQYLIRNYGGEELNAMDIFQEWLDSQVSDRMKNGLQGRRKDMLQHFIEIKDQQGNPIDKENVMVETLTIIGAGADTSSIAMMAIIGQLLLHPAEYTRVQEEIDKAYEELDLSDSDGDISYKDVEKLRYLNAVIKESMRLHPSITYQLPRVVQKGGLRIGSNFLPEGTSCGISAAVMNRSKELFGDDAHEWKPDRWLAADEADVKRIRVMDNNLTTFGMGSRGCIGRNLAVVTIHKYMAQFLRHFDAELVSQEKPWSTKSMFLSFQSDFWVHSRQRENAVSSV